MRAAHDKKQAARHREEHSHPWPDVRQAANQQRCVQEMSLQQIEIKRSQFARDGERLPRIRRRPGSARKTAGPPTACQRIRREAEKSALGVEFPPPGQPAQR
jgi:hypothetical protein